MSTQEEKEVIFQESYIVNGDTLNIPLWYPQCSEIKKFEIELMAVRAADSIQIEYDFNRNGWKISQASIFEWDGDDEECDPDWQEVAFIQAWGRKNANNGVNADPEGRA